MTDQTPVERAGSAIDHAAQEAVTHGGFLAPDTAAELAYEVIDTTQLADALHGDQCPEDPDPGDYCTCDGGHYDRLALAVKNWLTGKDQP